MIDSWSKPFLDTFKDSKRVQLYEVSQHYFLDERMSLLHACLLHIGPVLGLYTNVDNHSPKTQVSCAFWTFLLFKMSLILYPSSLALLFDCWGFDEDLILQRIWISNNYFSLGFWMFIELIVIGYMTLNFTLKAMVLLCNSDILKITTLSWSVVTLHKETCF